MQASFEHPPRLEEHLCFGMYATSMAITRAYKPLLDRLGITFPQYLALVVLWETDGPAVGELARRLELDASTITPLVKRLESAGFVRRRREMHDERIVTVHLTPKGDRLRHDAVCLANHLADVMGKPRAEIMDGIARIDEFRNRINSRSAE